MQNALNGETVGEVGMKLDIAGKAVEELGKRRNEGVLVADDVPWFPEVAEDRIRHVGDEQIPWPLLL